jgi:hypothetical protein
MQYYCVRGLSAREKQNCRRSEVQNFPCLRHNFPVGLVPMILIQQITHLQCTLITNSLFQGPTIRTETQPSGNEETQILAVHFIITVGPQKFRNTATTP